MTTENSRIGFYRQVLTAKQTLDELRAVVDDCDQQQPGGIRVLRWDPVEPVFKRFCQEIATADKSKQHAPDDSACVEWIVQFVPLLDSLWEQAEAVGAKMLDGPMKELQIVSPNEIGAWNEARYAVHAAENPFASAEKPLSSGMQPEPSDQAAHTDFLNRSHQEYEQQQADRQRQTDEADNHFEKWVRPWDGAWNLLGSAISDVFTHPGQTQTTASLVDAVTRIAELARGTICEKKTRLAATRCQGLCASDPTGNSFGLGNIGDVAKILTLIVLAIDGAKDLPKHAAKLRIDSPHSKSSCLIELDREAALSQAASQQSNTEIKPPSATIPAESRSTKNSKTPIDSELTAPFTVARLTKLMKSAESYNERAKAQMAKVTGPPETGSKSAYYIRTAQDYGTQRNQAQSQYCNQPGVERLKLLCEVDGLAVWGSQWVIQQRALYCLKKRSPRVTLTGWPLWIFPNN